uniref:Retrovirus-related Pol polyprotein from transposon TNT 1-94 n=1 Tax=Tanacetum cinerariifolium TaxID=118510 RepID=A0A6L2NH77_TANCI|nr:retrovirus-related Pol polyprotein from transposon TNT 1-94 [Tanacetum cinerariifolium]
MLLKLLPPSDGSAVKLRYESRQSSTYYLLVYLSSSRVCAFKIRNSNYCEKILDVFDDPNPEHGFCLGSIKFSKYFSQYLTGTTQAQNKALYKILVVVPMSEKNISKQATEKLSAQRENIQDRSVLSIDCHRPFIQVTADSGFELTGFSDADYAGCKDTFKSTFGGAQFLGKKLVSWSSKKQDCTALSTAEAEYASLFACCAQVLWILTQLMDYGFYFDKIPIYCDSKSAIAISCNPVQHSRTKHIAVHYHFIKEHVEKGTIELYFVKTYYQLADIFTKALPTDRFNYLVRRLGMRSLSPKELEHLAKSQ